MGESKLGRLDTEQTNEKYTCCSKGAHLVDCVFVVSMSIPVIFLSCSVFCSFSFPCIEILASPAFLFLVAPEIVQIVIFHEIKFKS